jgi:uncharacterized membrane protein YphA (DoxX/SURF4 family)
MIKERGSALAALAIRQGLALVLFGWGYDLYFNPRYYAKLVGEVTTNPAVPAVLMAAMLGLAALLMTGLATRVAAVGAAALFGGLLVFQSGHQPIGLPQNLGLAGAAIALALFGPGDLAVIRGPVAAAVSRRADWARLALRAGLGATFLVYGVQKFTELIEYRIVVSEIPALGPAVALFGAERTVYAVGVLELLVAFAMFVPQTTMLGALGQGVMLLGLVATVGYPFSYPQDVGLLAAIAAVGLSTWSARPAADDVVTPVVRRRAIRTARREARAPQPVPVN